MTSENYEDNNLRALRKEKGLSLSDVSKKLKLTSDTIRKIENGEFKSLGAYTYVRGYLMHYTALLGVDAQPYLDMIPKSDFEVAFVNTGSNLTKGIKLKRQSKNMANYILGTFLVLVICLSGWYLLKHYPKFSKADNNDIQIVEKGGDQLNIPEITTDGNITRDSLLPDNKTEGQQDSFHYSSLIPANPENTMTTDELQIPAQSSLSEQSAINSDMIEKEIPAEKEELTAAYEVVIQATETSWVKVEQSDGIKLHNDLLKPGSVTLKADQSLHFRIGNKQHVTVTINGEDVDLSRFSRKDIADFNWPYES